MIRTVVKFTDNKVFLEDTDIEQSNSTLMPGVYDFEYDNYNRFSNLLSIDIPQVYPLMPSSEIENIENFIATIFSKEYEDLCKNTKILNKNGILLHGEAGIGKSNYCNYIITKAISEKRACVFNIDSYRNLIEVIEKVKELRNIQNNLFVILLEEIDELFRQAPSVEGTLKNFMDGINSINNVLFIATTNYFQIIPKSLVERPSRFKKVLKIEQSQNVYELKKWLEDTYKGFIPDINEKEYEGLHDLCLNKPIDEIKHILIDYKMGIKNIEKNKSKVGFK